MTKFGLAKIEAAKQAGSWEKDPRPVISMSIPAELADALARDNKAREFFGKLAPTYQKHFIGWIVTVTAKREETRTARVKEAMALLARGRKLGLK